MELRDALTQIDEIRLQLARAQQFRGFRALPTALSGLLAGVTALAQALFLADPAGAPLPYAALWVGCALVCIGLAGGAIAHECARSSSPLTIRRARQALERLAPTLAAGALVTAALLQVAPGAAWLLPGLWQVLFSLGLFACRSLLPRGIGFVAAAYLVSGGACLVLGPAALSPWAMALPFGLGQLWAAAVLHLGTERVDAPAD